MILFGLPSIADPSLQNCLYLRVQFATRVDLHVARKRAIADDNVVDILGGCSRVVCSYIDEVIEGLQRG